jgi:SOS response regulatory protein OraA/RecX
MVSRHTNVNVKMNSILQRLELDILSHKTHSLFNEASEKYRLLKDKSANTMITGSEVMDVVNYLHQNHFISDRELAAYQTATSAISM